MLKQFYLKTLQKLDFKFPLSVSCVHFICSSIGAYIVIKVLKIKPLIVVDPEDRWKRIFPMSFVFCINIVLGNISLRYIPVSFMQTIKSFTPATTGFLLEDLRNKKHNDILCSVLIVFFWCEGSCVTVVGMEEIFRLAYLGVVSSHCWRDSSDFYYRA